MLIAGTEQFWLDARTEKDVTINNEVILLHK